MRTPVGDRYVLEHMREHGFNVGGEPSGHIILSDYTTTGDGLVAALQVLAVVKKLDKPVSEACHRFEPLPQVLKSVRYRSGKPLESSKVRSAIASAEHRLNGHGRLVIRPVRHRAGDPRHGRRRRQDDGRRDRRRHRRRADRSGRVVFTYKPRGRSPLPLSPSTRILFSVKRTPLRPLAPQGVRPLRNIPRSHPRSFRKCANAFSVTSET